jgi:hypothetical protein
MSLCTFLLNFREVEKAISDAKCYLKKSPVVFYWSPSIPLTSPPPTLPPRALMLVEDLRQALVNLFLCRTPSLY